MTFVVPLEVINQYAKPRISAVDHLPIKDLCQGRLGQSSDLLIEELLGLLPDASVGAVVQSKETGQESLAEHFRALAGEQGGEVINADHAQGRAALQASDGDGGLVECGGDIIQGNGVEGVGAVLVSLAQVTSCCLGTYVSALTSQITERLRLGLLLRDSMFTKADAIVSVCYSGDHTLMNGGCVQERTNGFAGDNSRLILLDR